MNEEINDNKRDYLSPELGSSRGATEWKASVREEQVLLAGSSAEKPPKSSQKKDIENLINEHKTMEVNGKRWEYLEYGNPEGIPILNIHGWLGASVEGNELLSKALTGEIQNSVGLRNLEANVPKGAEKVRALVEGLKGKYHIIAPQLPGFGHSEALDEPILDNMADELASFQNTMSLGKSVIFGSSMGGILGIKFAARHPDALRALIIQGTMTQPRDMNTIMYIAGRVAAWKPIAGFFERHPGTARGIFKKAIQRNEDFKLATPENQKLMLSDMNVADLKTVLSTFGEIGSHLEADIDRIKVPVVVLDGMSGELVPIAKSKDIAGRFHRQEEDSRENLRTNIAERKTMYFQVGGAAGRHGHSVINSAPEQVAIMMNHAMGYTNAGVSRD